MNNFGEIANFIWGIADDVLRDLHVRGKYADVPGFCKAATLEGTRDHGHILIPGRYVGAEPQPEDAEPFAARMKRLTAELENQFAGSAKLEKEIRKNPKGLGHGL